MRAGGYYLLNNITVLYMEGQHTDSHYFCLLGRRSGYESSKMHVWANHLDVVPKKYAGGGQETIILQVMA